MGKVNVKQKNIIHFKDEGDDLYITRLLPDGRVPEPNEMYEFGTLKERWFNKKEAIAFAKSIGFKYTFG